MIREGLVILIDGCFVYEEDYWLPVKLTKDPTMASLFNSKEELEEFISRHHLQNYVIKQLSYKCALKEWKI